MCKYYGLHNIRFIRRELLNFSQQIKWPGWQFYTDKASTTGIPPMGLITTYEIIDDLALAGNQTPDHLRVRATALRGMYESLIEFFFGI